MLLLLQVWFVDFLKNTQMSIMNVFALWFLISIWLITCLLSVVLVNYLSLFVSVVICVLTLAGECSNKECPFLHIDPESKIKDCPWYDRGFCKHGRTQNTLFICTVYPTGVKLFISNKTTSLLSLIHLYYHISVPDSCQSSCLRSWLQTQTHEKGDLCELPSGFLSGRKIL